VTPTTPSEREPILDALRGFAILGILLVNIEVMRGSAWLVAMGGGSVAASALPDRIVQFAIGWLASGKFVSTLAILFGIGAGWNREEMRNHGTDPSKRFVIMRERVEAMKAIWTGDEAEYHGEVVDFDPIWQWPKPVQKPHPPVMVGGMGERVVERVLEYGDGWFPQPGRMPDDDSFVARLEELTRHGRDDLSITVFGANPKPASIERYEQAGATRAVFWIPPGERDEVEGQLGSQVGHHGPGQSTAGDGHAKFTPTFSIVFPAVGR